MTQFSARAASTPIMVRGPLTILRLPFFIGECPHIVIYLYAPKTYDEVLAMKTGTNGTRLGAVAVMRAAKSVPQLDAICARIEEAVDAAIGHPDWSCDRRFHAHLV